MTRFPLRRRHVTSARAVRVMRVPLITAASGASNSKKGKIYTFSQVRHNRTENEYSTIINNTSSRYFTAISISLSLFPKNPSQNFFTLSLRANPYRSLSCIGILQRQSWTSPALNFSKNSIFTVSISFTFLQRILSFSFRLLQCYRFVKFVVECSDFFSFEKELVFRLNFVERSEFQESQRI